MKQLLVEYSSRLIFRFLRLVGKLPDRLLLLILNAFRPLEPFIKTDDDSETAIVELRGIIRDFPGGGHMIRSIISEGRPSQLVSTVRGLLRHQVLAADHLRVCAAPMEKELKACLRGRGKALSVGVIGSGNEPEMLQGEYSRRSDCRVAGIGHADNTDALRDIDGLEIWDAGGPWEELALRALEEGVAVSVHHSCIGSPTVLSGLRDASIRHRTPLRVAYPNLYYHPIQLVRSLVERGELGEIASVRVQATVGGRGGSLPAEAPPPHNYLRHPAFDHLLLLACLGGPLREVAAFLNPMDPRKGGQGVVSLRYSHPGRYGVLECAFAPEMFIKSALYPYSLELEIAGTDGVAWVRAGMGELSQAPPVWVRVGRRSYPLGVEAGVVTDWESACRYMALHFVSMMRGGSYQAVGLTEAISALDAREKSYEEDRCCRVLSVCDPGAGAAGVTHR